MNHVALTGNLTKDVEVKTLTINNKSVNVANFTLAVPRVFKKHDGTKEKDVTFIPMEIWDSGCDTFGKICSKGDLILIEGSLKMDNYERDGHKISQLKVRVSSFQKLPRLPAKEKTPEYIQS